LQTVDRPAQRDFAVSVGLVIGAAGGIGGACATALAGSVGRMLLVDRDKARLPGIAEGFGKSALPVLADIGEAGGRTAIVRAVTETGDALRWLVLASGVPLRGGLDQFDEAAIADTFQANLLGPVLLLRALADVRWTSPASVIVIGSISATRALPNRSVYGASKAGLEHLAMSLGAEWAERGIRVNVVAPGVIATPFLGSDHARLDAWAAERVPRRRTGRPEEVASVVRYLATEAPDYVVGARIPVDGGMEATA
jgi:NAD(P)-dependent dehydrogenase (short-subunit alcohol dehydrogenase family)